MTDKVVLDVKGPIAVITNNRPEKRNAFDDEMDVRLFEILSELKERRDVRAIIWRGEGPVWSAGRDVSVIGTNTTTLSHHELMTRGHQGILQLFDLDVPSIAALHGWAIGGSFQRALLCDIRIAADGTRFQLPELSKGVIPDTGGMGRLFEFCGSGVASDLINTGRVMSVDEAYMRGIVSRRCARGARRHSMGDGGENRCGPDGDGEAGPSGTSPPERAAGPLVDGGRADLSDLHQPVG